MHPRTSELIRELGLDPHPEGGHYRRIYASTATVVAGGRVRPALTAIRYLLPGGERSRWHRVDADEAWHWQEGEPLELLCFDAANGRLDRTVLGDSADRMPAMQVVPAGTWQCARPLGAYALVACTVSPGFDWSGFELLDGTSAVARELSRLGALHAPDRAGD